MNLTILGMTVKCTSTEEHVAFGRITYFHGQMGAGKSSIARLLDYCLGGQLELTPALQDQFVSVAISLTVGDVSLELERGRGADQVLATWQSDSEAMRALVPARNAAGEVVPGSGVHVLSDLLFWLSGNRPPKVRRSKVRDDSELIRLSIRNLLWFCYLDQDTIDSDFFHLDRNADPHKRLQSRDVLRLLLGFHQERVSELEVELEETHGQRTAFEASAGTLFQVLSDLGIEDEMPLRTRRQEVVAAQEHVAHELAQARTHARAQTSHPADEIRTSQRRLAAQLADIDQAISDIAEVNAGHLRHLNELKVLSIRASRTTTARQALQAVKFESCPCCELPLPPRSAHACHVCGSELQQVADGDSSVIERDVRNRIKELSEIIERRKEGLQRLHMERARIVADKSACDASLNEIERNYDSALVAELIRLEGRAVELRAEVDRLDQHITMRETVEKQRGQSDRLKRRESALREELRAARELAERDTRNLDRLGEIFLDCLVRSRIPGFSPSDTVTIESPWLLPKVEAGGQQGLTVTSFATLGSGGKKTLFKCCFAIAVHRLAVEIGALLPHLLIIDSPMKNISERENQLQFEGFHRLIYELAQGELDGTQFVLIDKEYFGPPEDSGLDIVARRMSPDQDPLIHAYRGH